VADEDREDSGGGGVTEIIDSILKYLSLITVAGAAISFVIGLVKYLDQRAREERTKRYQLFHGLMRHISAQGEKASEGVPLTQQIAAVYELQHFHEYASTAIPILEYTRDCYRELNAPAVLLKAIDDTLLQLRARA
jgi:hypothetical protein